MAERVTDETEKAEREEMSVPAGAPEVPTPEEEAAAERYGEASASTREHYQAYVGMAADQQGEGRIS